MAIRSMTAYAQVKGRVNEELGFTLTLKTVNHRFLDLHFRLPAELEGLEIKLRALLKQRLARGHVQIAISLERSGAGAFSIDRSLVGGFLEAYRVAATEFGVAAPPDLNVILRMPGALVPALPAEDGFESAVLAGLQDALERLERMRRDEGSSMERELRQRAESLRRSVAGIEKLREAISRAYLEKVQSRLEELIGDRAEPQRILQEAALLAERSDVREETVRLQAHLDQFLALLDSDGEAGKKLDFLLQEMNREANTILSKTSGTAGEALRVTELGLAMKSDIEKAREQVQNVE